MKTERVLRRLLATLLICQWIASSSACRTGGQPHPSEGTDPELAHKINELVSRYVELGDFTGVVYVARDEDVLFGRAYGQASHELAVSNSIDTAFLVGSMSKQLTAAAILLLQQDGSLAVEDALERFIPEYPRADEITLHQLLTHTAGIPDVYELPQFATQSADAPRLGEIVGYLAARPFHFDPGTSYSYSNGGYTLLARVIEVVAKQPYPAFVEERIFRPLAMNGSGVLKEEIAVGLAQGYDPRGVTGFRKAPSIGSTWMHGSGSVYSTAPDLHRWDRALRDDVLLSTDSRRIMMTDYGNGYGYGVSVYERYGDTVIEHDGRLAGYASDLARYLRAKSVVILLSNVQSVARDHLRDDIAALLFSESPAERAPRVADQRVVDAGELADVVGSYGFGSSLTVRVRSDGRSLWLRANEGGESEFFPAADGTFFSRTLYAAVSFARGPTGSVDSMKYMPEGASFEGRRLQE